MSAPEEMMLEMFAFSRHKFDTGAKATALLDLVNSSPYAPAAFSSAEPIRHKLTKETRAQAAALLSGSPQHAAGSLFLSSKDPKATLMFRWVAGATSRWYAELDSGVLAHRGGREAIIQFLLTLFRECPVVFAGVASDEEWNAKHWVTEEDEDGGEVTTKLGLDLDHCLPGVYWITVFGQQLAEHFGRKKLSTNGANTFDLGKAGVAVIFNANPVRDQSKLMPQEQLLIKALGEKFFFDISAPDRKCTRIPGVTST